MPVDTIQWTGKSVRIIDQTLLPGQLKYIDCRDVKTLWIAIKTLQVRGAPALGIAAAFGVLLGIKQFKGQDPAQFASFVLKLCDYIGTSRPTAVNLFNALNQMRGLILKNRGLPVAVLKAVLEAEALAIFEEDKAVCRAMGAHGAKLVRNGGTYMTVCNAGGLATADYGTALGVFYAAKEAGKSFQVFSLETRPLLQGARLTTWELLKNKIDVTLICDNMAASVMKNRKIDGIFAGADRIASNGDAANKIGTYMLAVLAKHHGVPFYIVAPKTTFDMNIASGDGIPIEERSADEVRNFVGRPTAPKSVKVFNPAFDVTPVELITGIVTEYGVIREPSIGKIRKVLSSQSKKG
ncbi:MAG: S-methyl-5-thioribose-1-phosphate isomerase [Candidatus Omnitrophica bacterium]|nr:S-methyl-5-thioribose-1-phosphate isomerase [Candidatus Omnitrophota bacterium]